MSDSFSFPEREPLCQRNAETIKAELYGIEKAGVQTGSICPVTLTAQGKGMQCIAGYRQAKGGTAQRLTAPTVSGLLCCKMKGQSVLHHLSENIRQEMSKHEKIRALKPLRRKDLRSFEKKGVVVCT